ncbi:MAS20-domain-containing protein [Ceratobasidium sp. AG-I]|nr:MAS20-domain-containing protein [Ceratobasidium sp. AG-I]
MVETRTIVAASTLSAAVLLGGYLIYFDHKRRNDPDFRKKLRKEKKKAAKAKPADGGSPADIPTGRSQDDLKAMLALVNAETLPSVPAEREKYFMDQVGAGEQLLAQGPAFEVPAALTFYRALRAYPSPVEIIMIFQNTLPPHIFSIVMELASLDVKQRAEGYYDVFPPKKMNVKISNLPMKDKSGKPLENEGVPVLRSALVAIKNIKAGEVIYKENAVVTALDLDLQALRSHCTHCLRKIEFPTSFPSDPLDSAYCSKPCYLASKNQSQNVLFGLEPPLPTAPEDDEKPKTEADLEVRRAAQEKFVEILRKTGVSRPLLVARFVASMVAEQSAKFSAALPGSKSASPAAMFKLPEPEGDQTAYSFYDHIERLKFLEILETPEEVEEREALKDVLKSAMEGLEEFVGDRYALLKGKMAYNAIGVSFSGGRDDKPAVTVRPEDIERTRTPYGTSRQTGSAFYRVSSHLTHSCAPNTRPSFPNGIAELHLIANTSIPAGTELTMAFVDVQQGPAETKLETRRRRRQEIARGWRFACECERCLKEVEEGILKEDENKSKEANPEEEDRELEIGAGAKLEDAVRRFGSGEQPAAAPGVE